jgi:hypothetical protein
MSYIFILKLSILQLLFFCIVFYFPIFYNNQINSILKLWVLNLKGPLPNTISSGAFLCFIYSKILIFGFLYHRYSLHFCIFYSNHKNLFKYYYFTRNFLMENPLPTPPISIPIKQNKNPMLLITSLVVTI